MGLKILFESIARKYPYIKFIKVNVDEQQGIATRYGIRGIPYAQNYRIL
jgi:thioredoxin-like negative regulator of GroEL